MLAWNSASGRSVSDGVETALGENVVDRSVSGASMTYSMPISGQLGLRIPSQFVPGSWDWVILNGGGNDLWLGCGCNRCERKLARLISADGQLGEIPGLVGRIRMTGAKVIYLGYLRTPGRGSPIDHCAAIGTEFEDRLAAMAERDTGIHFIELRDLVPDGDLSYHALDRIHPSAKGSQAIASRIATVILGEEG